MIPAAFHAFSLLGRAERIRLHRDKWVGGLVAATLLGVMIAAYEKLLLQELGLRVNWKR